MPYPVLLRVAFAIFVLNLAAEQMRNSKVSINCVLLRLWFGYIVLQLGADAPDLVDCEQRWQEMCAHAFDRKKLSFEPVENHKLPR